MHSDWFHGVDILQSIWQHREEVGYWYPSGLAELFTKWLKRSWLCVIQFFFPCLKLSTQVTSRVAYHIVMQQTSYAFCTKGIDRSLARSGTKQATATTLGIYSTYSLRSSIHFLDRFRFLWPCIVSKVWREKKNQQVATIRCLLSTSVSTCFGHHYSHIQENKTVFLHMVYCSGSAGCGW